MRGNGNRKVKEWQATKCQVVGPRNESSSNKMLDLSVFKEPIGVMRVFQLVFAICAFATTTSYTNSIDFECPGYEHNYHYEVDYPFRPTYVVTDMCNGTAGVRIIGDFSSDCQFFVATGIIATIYPIAICVVYTMLEDIYKTDARLPYFDFGITVIIAVFWLSGTAAWANSVAGLKHVTDPKVILSDNNLSCCSVATSNFASLNISIIIGFLNFFLWASDLWFVYKETAWFQLRATPSGV